MAEAETTSTKRARRSTEISRNLEQARQRLASQLAAERDREERLKEALRDFITARQKIAGAEERCEEKVAELQNRIRRLRELAREKIAGAHIEQARAALTMHEAGRTMEQVADLLALSQKETRRLIGAGRDAEAEKAPGTQVDRTTDGVGASVPTSGALGAAGGDAVPTESGEQRDLAGVDAHLHGPDFPFGPAASAYGGGEEPVSAPSAHDGPDQTTA